jgi:predicted transcriptional regulator of viral defense system
MFTSAQAQALGVDRMALSRLSAYGQIDCVARGVYRAATAPRTREEDVYAAWLALDPTLPAYERSICDDACVASLNTAAWLLDLGELKPEPLVFSCKKRRQSRSGRIKFLKRELAVFDVTVAAGIPVTSPRRTILDLLDYGEDLSLVSAVLEDAETRGLCGDITDEVNDRARTCGFPGGFDLYGYMKGGTNRA